MLHLIEAFDAANESLLILGAPGAGKTIALLELGHELLDRAEADRQHPIPVILKLASWSVQHISLATWIVDELSVRYGVASKVAQAWISTAQLLLLRDGLDEVNPFQRAECVRAINEARHHPGLIGIVVCCRTADYDDIGVQLELEGAVEVQPPTFEQIDEYLINLGERTPGLRAALQADSELRVLARTPLMLYLLLHIYHGAALEAQNSMDTIVERGC